MTRIKSFIKRYMISKLSYKFIVRDWIKIKDIDLAAQVLNTLRFRENLEPISSNGPTGKKILVISPHPDDEIFGLGGTLIKMIESGADILVLYLTKGKKSLWKKVSIEAEQIATHMGYKLFVFDNYSKNMPFTNTFITEFAEKINEFKPETIFIPFLLDDHDDHRRASHLLYLAESRHLIKTKYDIWAYQVYTTLIPNITVDITDVADEKKATIKMWHTFMAKRDWVNFSLGLNAFNIRYTSNPSTKYIEAFFVLPSKDYLDITKQYFANKEIPYYNPNYKHELDLV